MSEEAALGCTVRRRAGLHIHINSIHLQSPMWDAERPTNTKACMHLTHIKLEHSKASYGCEQGVNSAVKRWSLYLMLHKITKICGYCHLHMSNVVWCNRSKHSGGCWFDCLSYMACLKTLANVIVTFYSQHYDIKVVTLCLYDAIIIWC